MTYGARSDGTKADATTKAMQKALLAAAGGVLYIPPGLFLLNAALIQPNDAVTIIGAGQGVAELRWTADALTRGIHIFPDDASKFVTIRDIRMTTLGQDADVALLIDCTSQIVDVGGVGNLNFMDRIQSRVLLENVTICGANLVDSGDPFNTGWAGCLNVLALGAIVRGCTIVGRAATAFAAAANSIGMSFYGTPVTDFQNGHPVQFVVEACSFWFCDIAAYFINCEGDYVTNCNIVACNNGVVAFSNISGGHPQLCVMGTHANCFSRCIHSNGQAQTNINGCNLYLIQTSTAGIGILIDRPTTGTPSGHAIYGNSIISLGANSNGIVIDHAAYALINGNYFQQVDSKMVSCIWLTANSSNCKGAGNGYNGTFANTVLDSGTANAVT